MDWDDLEPRKAKKQPRPLDPLSIEELEAYIVELGAEIERARGEIARKKAVRAAASAFFKS
jgi:uncharacterized small protein (DUF1192 family)